MYKKRGRKNKKPQKELFEYQYYTLNMTGEQMAQMYNVKPRTIYNWATEYRKKRNKRKVHKYLSVKQIFKVNKKE